MREMVGGCCVCSDDRGWSENPLVYCDGQSCTVAVHQACYGIVTVPTGPWYCRKCESQERSVKVKCELCPSKYGALKRTDNSGWAHVVCALYIPEVRFGNVTTMEPIQLQLIPAERFNKVCYICEEKGKAANATVGACMQCNKSGCRQQFHVTCAQGLGLLCEEAGNYLDNVKYCGYCQHHYSKLKKWGNVKTIPPYKPVSTENQLSDSNSEKDTEVGSSTTATTTTTPNTNVSSTIVKSSSTSPATTSKRKSSGSVGKSSSSSSSSSSSKSSSGKSLSTNSSTNQQKPVHSGSNKSSDKIKQNSSNSLSNNSKSAKNEDISANSSANNDTSSMLKDIKVEENDNNNIKSESKDNKSSKKRKTNSRTPTPVSANDNLSVVISSSSSSTSASVSSTDKKTVVQEDKPKKPKIETTQSIITNQPVVALTSISTIKVSSPKLITNCETTTTTATTNPFTTTTTIESQQHTTSTSVLHTSQSHSQPINSLVVSVPLTSTSISPHNTPINNQTSVLANTIMQERSCSSGGMERTTPLTLGATTNSGILSSEMSGGGLKITYEKQESVINHTEVDMELEITRNDDLMPSKRARSQSNDKNDKPGRGKKRNNNGANGLTLTNPTNNNNIMNNKRSIRAQHTPPPPPLTPQQSTSAQPQPGAFAAITQSQLKDSPPSSPSSESQQSAPPVLQQNRGRTKGRKSAPANIGSTSSSSKDSKDIKLFQNGITAPHMLGNQLNPNSNMAQKMSDHLNSELEAHSIFNPSDNTNSNLIGPQLHHRVVQTARASSVGGSSTASGGSGISSMISGTGGGNIPQTLDQLLERQWEQGSQFLMEQAQHFDIASLLSCLHQLCAENLRLEEDLTSLLQRRDHLLAVNARLAIPLTGQPSNPQTTHTHTVNNIHPNVGVPHGDLQRPPRSNIGYTNHPQNTNEPLENGILPTDQTYSHRSPLASQQSPNVRHSGTNQVYNNSSNNNGNSGLLRQSADTSGRSAPRPQPYPLYQNPGPSQQQQQQQHQPQVVIRRDADIHHQNATKPS